MNSVTDGDYTGDFSEAILSPSQKVTVSGIWGLKLTQEPTLRGQRIDCRCLCLMQQFVRAKGVGKGKDDLCLKWYNLLIPAGFILGKIKQPLLRQGPIQ